MNIKTIIFILFIVSFFSCNSYTQEQNNSQMKDTVNTKITDTMTKTELQVYNTIKEAGSSGITPDTIVEKTEIPLGEVEKILKKFEIGGIVSKTKASYHDKIKGEYGILLYTVP